MARALLTPRVVWLLAILSLSVGVWRSAPDAALEDFRWVMHWAGELLRGTHLWVGLSDVDSRPARAWGPKS
jgi:hypothetical protein